MPDKEEVTVAEVVEETAVATVDAGLLERLASNPDVDVDKFERLIALRNSEQEREAEAAFVRAFVKLQADLPEIGKRGKSHQNMYAKMEDIQRALKPVLEPHGFVLNYFLDTEGHVKVTARLSHAEGHYQETSFTTKPDDSGKKNDIQAQGSAQSYAARYATLALLNLTTHDMDDDGAGSQETPEAPAGYEDWLMDMELLAEEGTKRLHETWKVSDPDFRRHLTTHNAQGWNKIKDAARKAGA